MKRRHLLPALGVLLVMPAMIRAQQSGRSYRIGVLETQPVTLNADNIEALREGLRVFGYVEGKNLIIEYRSADGRGEKFSELATELLQLHPDVIVTRGTPAALAARSATSTTPIVMAAIGDPLMVATNLVRPGRNITGLSGYTNELEAKRLELLHELAPSVTRVGALYDMGNPVVPPLWEELRRAGSILAIEVRLFDIRKRDDIAQAINQMLDQGVGAIVVGVDSLSQTNKVMITDLALHQRLPAIYVSREFVDVGGLIAYGPSYRDLYRRAATYIDKIFRGESPGNLPIEQPTKFELVINQKTAKALGLIVSPTLLARADEVVE